MVKSNLLSMCLMFCLCINFDYFVPFASHSQIFHFKQTGTNFILKCLYTCKFCHYHPFQTLESLVIPKFLFTFENSFTIFTLKFCSNIMLLFLVFLYLFYICALLPTNFAIQTTFCDTLVLFYLTSVYNWISLGSVAMC